MKEKEAYNPPKVDIWEHVREEFIIYHYQHKGDQAIIDRTIFWKLGTIISRSYSGPNEPIMEK